MSHLWCPSQWGRILFQVHKIELKVEKPKNCCSWPVCRLVFQSIEQRETSPPGSGEHCGGCRRSNSTERPHAFQVILAERPPLELSANDEQDMAEWMQLLCQSVSKGVRGLLSAEKKKRRGRQDSLHLVKPTGHPARRCAHAVHPLLPGCDGQAAADLPPGLSDQLLPLAGRRRHLWCDGGQRGGQPAVLRHCECVWLSRL